MELFRNVSIGQRVILTMLLALALPIGIFVYVRWMDLATNFKVFLFLGLIFLLLGLISSWLVARSITRPIDRLRRRISGFVEKRVAQPVNDPGEDEIAELGQEVSKLFGIWNNEVGRLLVKQKQRGEETLKVTVAQSQLERQLELSRSCLAVAQRLNTSFHFQTNLQTILDEAIKTLNIQWGSILLINRNTLELGVACVRGIEQSYVDDIVEDQYPTIKLKPNEGLAGAVIKTGTPLIANKGHRDSRFKGFSEFKAREEKVASIMCTPIKGTDGTVLGVMNFINRISPPIFRDEDIPYVQDLGTLAALVIERNTLYTQVFADETTGLLGFRIWKSFLEEEAVRATRYAHPISLVALEIDHYRSQVGATNEDFGRQILTELGQSLKKVLRDSDAGTRVQERYYLLLPNTDASGAVYLVGRLKEILEKQTFEFQGRAISTTISAGIASFPETGPDARQLFKTSNLALEQATSAGSNRAVIFGRTPEAATNSQTKVNS